jgi:hypothetical protein
VPVLGSMQTADRPCIEVTIAVTDTNRHSHQVFYLQTGSYTVVTFLILTWSDTFFNKSAKKTQLVARTPDQLASRSNAYFL